MIIPYWEQSTPKSSDGQKEGQTDLIFSWKITVISDKRLQFTEWTWGTNKLTPQCLVTLITKFGKFMLTICTKDKLQSRDVTLY